MQSLKPARNANQASFLAEKVRRMQTAGGDAQEMLATIRDYLQNERQALASDLYEHTAHTAQIVPFARMKAV